MIKIYQRTVAFGLLLVGVLLVGTGYAIAAPARPANLTSALSWRSVGPYSGGRVTAVAGVPGEPNLYYAGYAGGGVWKTSDYGHHWQNITDKYFKANTTGSVGAMAVAPSNPKIIYVGTGDSAPRNTVLTGHGMYKSTDGGKTWSYIGLGKTYSVTWILISPKNPNVVYAAAFGDFWGPNADRGVFKTTDGGQTWRKILYVNDHSGPITMSMDPKDPQTVYVTMWQMTRRAWTFTSGGSGSGIYKTTNGGQSWKNITHNPGLPSGIFGKASVAVAPSSPNVVYALIQAKYKGTVGGLFRSDNAGRTWKVVNTSLSIAQRAFYYMRVYVDPKDPNTIYLPNVDLFVSHDGGKTLKKLHPPHGDNHALWIDPNNPKDFIEGNDGGATVTLDGGSSWSSEMNQPTGQFYHVNLDDQFPFHIYGAQQDRGSVDGPSAVRAGKIPPVWKRVQGGEMSWVVPEPGKPWVTYGSGYYCMEWKDNSHLDDITIAAPWVAWKFGSPGSAVNYRCGWWYHPVVFASNDPQDLLFGANVVFRSTDGGTHWARISPDLTRDDKSKLQLPGGPISTDMTGEEMFDTISALAISPLSDNVMWSGADDGLVYVTRNGGKHWSKVRPPALPKWSTITSIQPSFTTAGTAYLSASRYRWSDYHPYIYKTSDYGKHWTLITSGIPNDEYISAVRQDPDDPDLLFAAGQSTVYVSLDGGSQWHSLALNLAVVRVTDLQIQPKQHAVIISTFGRGFWVLDNLHLLEDLSQANVNGNRAHLFAPQQTWLWARGVAFPSSNPGGTNSKYGATVFFYLPKNYQKGQSVKLSFTDASGKVVNSFDLPRKVKKQKKDHTGAGVAKAAKPTPLHSGMNRFQWNLRYPTATEVNGIFQGYPGAMKPVGPQVLPGKYYAVLSYGGHTVRKPFVVKLNPELKTTESQLQDRFTLLMQIHKATNKLDIAINSATSARKKLEKAVADKQISKATGKPVLAQLNSDISSVVNFKIQADEGALVFPAQLRAWLSNIFIHVSYAFVQPTPAMKKTAHTYIDEVNGAVPRLRSSVAAAKSVLSSP